MTSRRPSILWVTEEVPDRDGGGGNIRQANLLIELARHLDLDLLVAGRVVDPAVRSAVRSIVEVDAAAPAPAGRAALWQLVRRGVPLTVGAAAGAVTSLRPELVRLAPSHAAVVLNHETLFPLVADIQGGARRILHPHNVASERAAQAAAVSARWRSRLVWRLEARAQRRLERRSVGAADVLLTCSHGDADALVRGLPDGRAPAVVVAPNGVDLERFRTGPPPGAGRVLFFGSLDYPPNVDGITWFVAEVWPRVRHEVPTAELAIVGRSPTAEVRRLAETPGVHVEADVPAAPPWYEATDVVVVPLRVGTGTRLKALEAMAANRPVVGTSIGLEGLGVDGSGEAPPALVSDDPAAIAAAVTACLRDDDLARRTGAAGRAHVERHYGWPVIAAELAARLAPLIDPTAPGDR